MKSVLSRRALRLAFGILLGLMAPIPRLAIIIYALVLPRMAQPSARLDAEPPEAIFVTDFMPAGLPVFENDINLDGLTLPPIA